MQLSNQNEILLSSRSLGNVNRKRSNADVGTVTPPSKKQKSSFTPVSMLTNNNIFPLKQLPHVNTKTIDLKLNDYFFFFFFSVVVQNRTLMFFFFC